jgi:hypothetical protein
MRDVYVSDDEYASTDAVIQELGSASSRPAPGLVCRRKIP